MTCLRHVSVARSPGHYVRARSWCSCSGANHRALSRPPSRRQQFRKASSPKRSAGRLSATLVGVGLSSDSVLLAAVRYVLLGLRWRGPRGRASADAFREKAGLGFDLGANCWCRPCLDVWPLMTVRHRRCPSIPTRRHSPCGQLTERRPRRGTRSRMLRRLD